MAQQTFSGVPGDFTAGQVLTAADMDKLREFLLYLIKEGDETDTGEVSPLIMDLGNDRVGIGTTAPGRTLSLNDTTNTYMSFSEGDSEAWLIGYEGSSNDLVFYGGTPGGTKAYRMQITDAGNVQVGYNGDYGSLNPKMLLFGTTADAPTLFISTPESVDPAVKFYSNTDGAQNDAGTISLSGATTTYGTTSDYRLKENVADLTGAVDRVKQLRPINFTWIKEPERGTMDGFIAHEVAEVIPQSVSGEKDAVLPAVEGVEAVEAVEATYDEDGALLTAAIPAVEAVDPWPERVDPQSLDTSHLVPLLTAAIQELSARVAALEAAA